MENPYKIFSESYSQGLKLDPNFSIADWSDKNRILPAVGSSESGRWQTKRTLFRLS